MLFGCEGGGWCGGGKRCESFRSLVWVNEGVNSALLTEVEHIQPMG